VLHISGEFWNKSGEFWNIYGDSQNKSGEEVPKKAYYNSILK
jgi:hypothetical protein